MRRLGLSSTQAFCRQAAIGAVLAGATILGSMASARAQGASVPDGTDEINGELAFAVPRVAPTGGRWGGVGLPQPLTPSEAARIRSIFQDQAEGDNASADRAIKTLTDKTLLGAILADRYLAPSARPTAGQLTDWLKTYGDQSDAPAIHSALKAVSPRDAAQIKAPQLPGLGSEAQAGPTPEEEDPAQVGYERREDLDRLVIARAEAGEASAALRLIAATRGIPAIYGAALRADVARILFTQGHDAQALWVGRDATARSGGKVGAGAYVAGLAAWRLGRREEAAGLFEAASRASLIPASTRAGAAFWAARAHLALGDPGGYRPWMLRAAAGTRTFYGLLAARRLGLGGWTPAVDPVGEDTLGEADVEAILAIPQGRRVFALLQVRQTERAEASLRQIWPSVDRDRALGRSIMLVAQAAGLTDLAAQVASILQSEDGRPHDAARFPTPQLRPRGGFSVDPALVYALTRLESNFDPRAVSGAGAHGLMQLMPVTAGFMAGTPDRFTGAPSRLLNPSVNLDLGQRYVEYLAGNSNVEGDLIRLLASYNAGPNRVANWSVGEDPLLFMESIPNEETRGFVHRALTYLWIYGGQLGLPSPSLDALAADIWPSYASEVALAGAPVVLH
jgi:soluble lytic murein transglycosylase-like protein